MFLVRIILIRLNLTNYIEAYAFTNIRPLTEPYPDQRYGTGCEPLSSYGSSHSRNHLRLSGKQTLILNPTVGASFAIYLEYVSPFAVTKFPKPLTGTTNYYGLIRPYSTVLVIWPRRFCISAIATCAVPLATMDRFSCSLNEPGYSSCRLYAGYRCSR